MTGSPEHCMRYWVIKARWKVSEVEPMCTSACATPSTGHGGVKAAQQHGSSRGIDNSHLQRASIVGALAHYGVDYQNDFFSNLEVGLPNCVKD